VCPSQFACLCVSLCVSLSVLLSLSQCVGLAVCLHKDLGTYMCLLVL